jgi:NAD(P)-dependent dehydrogenase (short-subunit alcohol dehydrogenase family)
VTVPPEAIVISGASTGIGADCAERLARDGFLVFAGVRSDADAARVEALHSNIRGLRLDVSDDASIAAAVVTVEASGAVLRAVVNNAGIAIAGPLEFLPMAEIRRQFDVNFFGALAVTQAFLPQLRRSRGRVVFVGSISGRLAVPFIAPYSTSKFALHAAADALRVELAPSGMHVALVEPSSVKTPIWEKGRASRDRLLSLCNPLTPSRERVVFDTMIASMRCAIRTATSFSSSASSMSGASLAASFGRVVVHAIASMRSSMSVRHAGSRKT